MNSNPVRIVVWTDASGDFAARIQRVPGIRVVGHASTAMGAWRSILSSVPDAVVLATAWPGKDAPALWHRLPQSGRPNLIVVSERPSDALSAFELRAVDCFAPADFDTAIGRALERIRAHQEQARMADAIRRFATHLQREIDPPKPAVTIDVQVKGRAQRVATSEIEVIESYGNYVKIATARGEFLHRATLKRCTVLLTDSGFFRAHRRFLVNDRCISAQTRSGELILRSGRVVPCGRLYRWRY